MNRHSSNSRMSAGCATLLAAAALALAGCSSGSSTSAVSSSASSPAGSATASTSAGGPFAGTALFPVAVGNTWVYKMTAVGLSTGTATDKITAVVPVAGGNQVTTTHQLNGTTVKETFLFGSDGSITMPLTSLGNATFKINSGGIVWPSQAQIDSGQPHTSTIAITTTIAGQTRNVTTHVTVRGPARPPSPFRPAPTTRRSSKTRWQRRSRASRSASTSGPGWSTGSAR